MTDKQFKEILSSGLCLQSATTYSSTWNGKEKSTTMSEIFYKNDLIFKDIFDKSREIFIDILMNHLFNERGDLRFKTFERYHTGDTKYKRAVEYAYKLYQDCVIEERNKKIMSMLFI